MNKYISLSLLLFLLTPTISFSYYSAEVRNISSREYYPAVKEVIDNAQESIHMAMYVLSLRADTRNQVYNLVNSLIEAKNRGVEVIVILDRSFNFFTGEIDEKNAEAYRYLSKNGVNVFYDDLFSLTHKKTLVIDEEVVVIGSSNWSQAALTSNHETSLIVRSPELAKSVLENLVSIKLDQAEPIRPFNRDSALAISMDFFKNEELAGRMITDSDERAFDVYILILNAARDESLIEFDYDVFAQRLGMDETMSRTAYRRQLIKTLRKLKRRYNLIDVEFRYAGNAEVTLLDLIDSDKRYEYPETDFFLLPSEYFNYGWHRKLPLSSKFCFLINCYMYERGGSRYWSLSRENLSKLFNLAPYTISKGMNELRRLNIIDIEYSSVFDSYETRGPARTELFGLYSPKEHQKGIAQLIEKYGEDSFNKARNFAEIVFRENDLTAIEDIINLTEEYGDQRINRAYEILSDQAIDNPKRTFRYAIGVIKSLRAEELE